MSYLNNKSYSFKVALLLLAALLFTDEVSAAQNLEPKLAISPSRIEISPEKKANESITVLNLGSKPMQVEVYVQNWDFDANNNYRALPPNEQSLDQWLIINPVRLTIPAKSQQTVRLAVRPRVEPEPGEHRAMVFFRQLNEDGKGFNFKFNVGVPIYAYFGDVKRKADVLGMEFDPIKLQFVFDIASKGNSYVRPEGVFVAMKATDAGSDADILKRLDLEKMTVDGLGALASGKLSAKPVFAGTRRQVTSPVPIKEILNEPYVVAIKVTLAGQTFSEVYRINIGE
ncbi:molecular chaperone [Kangiella sp.]|uniref:molecular chaperone n=1 Tax=Kangiella sp. TaxID=1920245 RepID=UPI00198748CB|nr:molecular chaperone [Kangiella sp.]MBD3654794.1 molecular chaperone [Kangiella sp.]